MTLGLPKLALEGIIETGISFATGNSAKKCQAGDLPVGGQHDLLHDKRFEGGTHEQVSGSKALPCNRVDVQL